MQEFIRQLPAQQLEGKRLTAIGTLVFLFCFIIYGPKLQAKKMKYMIARQRMSAGRYIFCADRAFGETVQERIKMAYNFIWMFLQAAIYKYTTS